MKAWLLDKEIKSSIPPLLSSELMQRKEKITKTEENRNKLGYKNVEVKIHLNLTVQKILESNKRILKKVFSFRVTE